MSILKILNLKSRIIILIIHDTKFIFEIHINKKLILFRILVVLSFIVLEVYNNYIGL